jgi:hypothetical protein
MGGKRVSRIARGGGSETLRLKFDFVETEL